MSVTFGLPILVWFPSHLFFIRWYPWFVRRHLSSIYHIWFLSVHGIVEHARGARMRGGGSYGWGKFVHGFACETIMARDSLCQPDGSESGFQSCRGMRSRASRIIYEYDLVNAIAIRTLIHPHTLEIGSSIFSAVGRLKPASMTRAFLPRIPSTVIKNDFFSVACGSAYCDYLYFASTTKPGASILTQTCTYEHQRHKVWCLLRCWSFCPINHGWVHKPLSPRFHSPGTPPLWSAAALVEEGFDIYRGWREGSSS